MTKIKLCGLTRADDIVAVNKLMPDYVGFVFAENSRRYVSVKKAEQLSKMLTPGITTVGVFVNAPVESVAELLKCGIIGMAQLHGDEDEEYMTILRRLIGKPIIQTVRTDRANAARRAMFSTADFVLLDPGAGSGRPFDSTVAQEISRPYFLAGGLTPDSVAEAVRLLHPYAVDVSSGIETNGIKDLRKMEKFVAAVRGEDGRI